MILTNREKGRIGLSMAINYFTIQGYTISLPLNDTQWYDMVVEKNNHFSINKLSQLPYLTPLLFCNKKTKFKSSGLLKHVHSLRGF